jgi:hypothetical protein
LPRSKPARIDIDLGSGRLRHGQGIEKPGQGDVRILLGHGLLGRLGEVRPARATQKAFENPLPQQLARRRPFVPATLREIIEGAAPAPGWKNEVLPQPMVGAVLPRAQLRPIEVAKACYLGVGTSTTGAVKYRHRGSASTSP